MREEEIVLTEKYLVTSVMYHNEVMPEKLSKKDDGAGVGTIW